jgi:type I restriction enzyme M protein
MLQDGKSLDDKRNLIVEEALFNEFAFAKDLTAQTLSKLAKSHDNFNLPQVLDHYRYLKSDYFKKMHTAGGELLHVKELPDNLGFDKFLDGTCTHNFADRTSQSFLVPFKEIKENDWDLSINRYKEIVYEEVVYDAPTVIIDRIDTLAREREQLMKQLKPNV